MMVCFAHCNGTEGFPRGYRTHSWLTSVASYAGPGPPAPWTPPSWTLFPNKTLSLSPWSKYVRR